MCSVAICKPVNFSGWILNRDQTAILEIHDLLAKTCAAYGVDACEPSLVFTPAGEAVALIWPFEEEVSDRRVV